ncbi:MAG: hypothetical protein GTO54_08590 [Nitrososphaeria archaeon]|nr:hypothetical protein [Nitrososphaeria archaeon]
MNALIDRLVEERGITKADIIRDLLNKGIDAQQILSEAEQMKEKLLEVETIKEAVSNLEDKYIMTEEELQQVLTALDQLKKGFTEQIEALKTRPQIMTPEDATILRKHLDTCTDPKCPYKEVFPELAPEEPETSEEQARLEPTEHKPPKRWSVADICRKAD